MPIEHKAHGRALLQLGSIVPLPPFPGSFSARPVADASVYAAAGAYEAAQLSASSTGEPLQSLAKILLKSKFLHSCAVHPTVHNLIDQCCICCPTAFQCLFGVWTNWYAALIM